MKRLRTTLFMTTLVAGACFSQDKSSEAQILKLTHEVLLAGLHSDRAAMDRLFTKNYTHTHQSGKVQDKVEFIAEFAPGTQKYRIAEISQVQVRHFGTSAIVNGHENVNDHHYLFTCFWVQEQGIWRMAAWVTSPAPKDEDVSKKSK